MPSLEPAELVVDVVIVGGGPTGLLTGLLCERLGASVCIIDSKPSTLDLGRADALNARTQQYLEVVGILDELLPQGLKCNTSSTYENGAWKSRQSHWWTSLAHTLHKNFLMIGQPVVEAAIASRIQQARILFDTRCVAVDEGATSVRVTTDHKDHPVIRGQYLVGADGARSTVRSLMGISFTGTKPEMVWTVLDTFIDTDFPRADEIVTFQHNGQSRVSWIPRERGMARFYTLLDPEQEKSQANSEASIREHMRPHKIDFVKTEWFSTFEIKERIAGTFVTQSGQGRVCLAGDAAHVHSVNGGQGLNTGIADAFALAWRLGYITSSAHVSALAPGAAVKLMRSYDTERRAVAQGVIDVASRLVRDTMHSAKQYVETIERNASYITGMGVAYDDVGSDLVSGGLPAGDKDDLKAMTTPASCWVPGRRCPDVHLIPAGGGAAAAAGNDNNADAAAAAAVEPAARGGSRVYALAEYGKFLVFLFGEAHLATDTTAWPRASHATFYKVLGPTAAAVVPTVAAAGEAVLHKGIYTVAEPGVAGSSGTGSSDSFAVVVRPDMYVGYVGQGDGWKSYLAEILA